MDNMITRQHGNDGRDTDSSTSKLRGLIEVTAFVVLFFVAMQLIQFIPPMLNLEKPYLVFGLALGSLALFSSSLILKRNQSSLKDLGLIWFNKPLNNIALGILIGLLVVSVMIGSLVILSNIGIQTVPSTTIIEFLGGSFLVILVLATMEEIVFRGYFLFELKRLIGTRWSVYITSMAFGLYHGISVESLIGPAIWGLVYAYMALKSRGLLLPIAFHFMVNWMQAVLNMKTKYAPGFYELVFTESTPILTETQVGLGLQFLMAIVSIVLIERHIRQEKKSLNY